MSHYTLYEMENNKYQTHTKHKEEQIRSELQRQFYEQEKELQRQQTIRLEYEKQLEQQRQETARLEYETQLITKMKQKEEQIRSELQLQMQSELQNEQDLIRKAQEEYEKRIEQQRQEELEKEQQHQEQIRQEKIQLEHIREHQEQIRQEMELEKRQLELEKQRYDQERREMDLEKRKWELEKQKWELEKMGKKKMPPLLEMFSEILELTDTTIPLVKQSNTVTFFYLESCPTCQKFKPIYQLLSEQNTSDVSFSQIDCEKYPDMLYRQQLNTFPTVRLFSKGKTFEYKGTLQLNEISDWINTCLTETEIQKGVVDLTNCNQIQTPSLVLLWSPRCGHCIHFKPVYFELAKQSPIPCTQLDGSSVSYQSEFQIRGFPSLFIVTSTGKHLYQGKRTIVDILQWVNSFSF